MHYRFNELSVNLPGVRWPQKQLQKKKVKQNPNGTWLMINWPSPNQNAHRCLPIFLRVSRQMRLSPMKIFLIRFTLRMNRVNSLQKLKRLVQGFVEHSLAQVAQVQNSETNTTKFLRLWPCLRVQRKNLVSQMKVDWPSKNLKMNKRRKRMTKERSLKSLIQRKRPNWKGKSLKERWMLHFLVKADISLFHHSLGLWCIWRNKRKNLQLCSDLLELN